MLFSDEVSSFSKRCVKDGILEHKQRTPVSMEQEVNDKIGGLIVRWTERQQMRLSSGGK